MDTAHLTLAHSHARSAAQETQKSNPKTATEQHELAAGEFASARGDTHESEAIRILSLLEQHHRQLAHVLRFDASLAKARKDEKEKDGAASATDASVSTTTVEKDSTTAAKPSTSPTRTRRDAHREMSSSIASKMAHARGKPSGHHRIMPMPQVPLAPHVERSVAGGERAGPGQTPALDRRSSTSAQDTNTPRPNAGTAAAKAADEGFTRFFTSFDSLFSKLSAPLAFAGLPLTAEAAQEAARQAEKDVPLDKSRVRSSEGPDVNKIFSKAAMRVLREENGPLQDSFYWVQPSGGTATYANVLNPPAVGAEGLKVPPPLARQGSSGVPSTIGEEAEGSEEFVDARENPGPPSPNRSRRGLSLRSRSGAGAGVAGAERSAAGGKTMEELELENGALRQLLDTQNRRLQMWEASSQAQSLALAQSMHAAGRLGPGAATALPVGEGTATAGGGDAEVGRIRELEDLLRVERASREGLERAGEKMSRENEKLLATLGRYREKWEQLKAGARRRDRGGGASGAPSTVGDGDGDGGGRG